MAWTQVPGIGTLGSKVTLIQDVESTVNGPQLKGSVVPNVKGLVSLAGEPGLYSGWKQKTMQV